MADEHFRYENCNDEFVAASDKLVGKEIRGGDNAWRRQKKLKDVLHKFEDDLRRLLSDCVEVVENDLRRLFIDCVEVVEVDGWGCMP
ncbi:hypothetical protein HPP92_025298 [Vanilla planifolia]|uniref:Uncharacterized protein n=1 Tax=Vanilla planifolia TaxID=51239 RepID=A0A835PIT5_VANPL|nr:hypothetical protein HPP92_025298 [Vanilla planifolia]